MFVELHMIQSFAPSNLNRDDTNNPKDCEFGGVRRARISSQCIKRAIRTSPVFAETTEVGIGTRTKRLLGRLREPLVEAGKSVAEATEVLTHFVPLYASKLADKDDKDDEVKKTAVLLYIGDEELDHIAEALLQEWDTLSDKKTMQKLARRLVKEHKGKTSAPDIALFGRMLAEKPVLNLDAACQVAHAISTHPVSMEMDFYTAVDDLAPDEETGAGMMGVTGFNSACFYRYARIDWRQLVANLNDDLMLAKRTVEGFLKASVAAVPTGKQNAFAAHNPPDFLLAVVANFIKEKEGILPSRKDLLDFPNFTNLARKVVKQRCVKKTDDGMTVVPYALYSGPIRGLFWDIEGVKTLQFLDEVQDIDDFRGVKYYPW